MNLVCLEECCKPACFAVCRYEAHLLRTAEQPLKFETRVRAKTTPGEFVHVVKTDKHLKHCNNRSITAASRCMQRSLETMHVTEWVAGNMIT